MKTATPVDRPTLENALATAEKNGPLSNLTSLWQKTAEKYNESKPVELKDISFSTVMLRVSEWGLEVKTLAGRKGKVKSNKSIAVPVEQKKVAPVVEEIDEKTTKHFNDAMKITIDELLACVHPIKKIQDENTIDLYHPVMIAECGLMNLPFNSAFGRIVISLKEKTISVWLNVATGRPDFVMDNVLV